jgi:hypothetical protein
MYEKQQKPIVPHFVNSKIDFVIFCLILGFNFYPKIKYSIIKSQLKGDLH